MSLNSAISAGPVHEDGVVMSEYEPPAAEPCWVDLMTSDRRAAVEFYGSLFGWEAALESQHLPAVLDIELNGHLITGFLENDHQPKFPDVWTTYLNVADIHAATFAVKMHGGTIYLEPTIVEGQGIVAVVGDPTGVGVGLWQAVHPKLTVATGRPGTRIWNELHTTAFDKVTRFYRDALGWKLSSYAGGNGFRYQSYLQGSNARAGIYDISMQQDPVPGWRTYFAVANTDESQALAEELGATVKRPAQDSPFGRMAVLEDLTGAEFSIIQTQPSH